MKQFEYAHNNRKYEYENRLIIQIYEIVNVLYKTVEIMNKILMEQLKYE